MFRFTFRGLVVEHLPLKLGVKGKPQRLPSSSRRSGAVVDQVVLSERDLLASNKHSRRRRHLCGHLFP